MINFSFTSQFQLSSFATTQVYFFNNLGSSTDHHLERGSAGRPDDRLSRGTSGFESVVFRIPFSPCSRVQVYSTFYELC